MLHDFRIEDDSNVRDIEINKVDQQNFDLNKYPPRKKEILSCLKFISFVTSAINGSSSSSSTNT